MKLLILFLLILSITKSNAQNPFSCASAPNLIFQQVCMQLQSWDTNARQFISQQQQIDANTVINAPAVPAIPSLSPAVPQPFTPTQYSCMDIGCLCSYMRGLAGPGGQCSLAGGGQLTRAYRKEYRQLTDNERQRFHNALAQLKASGEYDRLSGQHRLVGTASGAHSGPGFLPWHREYLKRFEIAVRMIDPGLAMPYWDSVLDFYLPNPRDSIIWSPQFLGEQDAAGRVVNGPFAGWRTLEGHPFITRHLGSEGRLFNESDLNNVFAQTEIQNILAYTAPQNGCPFPPNYGALEYSHASVHLWIGGDMKPPSTSANDPAFFLHHSFVDLIWEQWRQMRQSRWTREQAYSPDYGFCSNSQHFANANMRPFEITNRDGLSNAYTDNMYTFAPRPRCTHQFPTGCQSQYLFCDTRTAYAHCVSKIKLGGYCAGFEGLDACYNGICVNTRCVPGSLTVNTTPAPRLFNPQPNMTPAPIRQQQLQRQLPSSRQTMGLPAPSFASNNNIRRAPPRRTFGRRRPVSPSMQRQLRFQPRRQQQHTQRRRLPAASNNIRRAPQRSRIQTCFNDDPCCSLWAARNECRVNTNYMSRYCKRSCGYCRSNAPNMSGCYDRHQSCAYFRSQGECTRRRQWMSENCRRSCGWCNIPLTKLCASVARFSRM